MIKPLNSHVLIAPIKHEDFVEGANSNDEMGEVIAVDETVNSQHVLIEMGDIVFFDSYLCAKYPSDDPEVPYWLVPFSAVRAKK